jgi:hypothetical protein
MTMLDKQELYDILKNDGAKLPRAVNFMGRDELVTMYAERFGINPDTHEEQTNTTQLSDNTEMQNAADTDEEQTAVIPLLKFAEDGWCTPLNKPYCKGLYRPVSAEEYRALKKYASEEIYA